jgi:hypothetical protein
MCSLFTTSIFAALSGFSEAGFASTLATTMEVPDLSKALSGFRALRRSTSI